MSAWWSTTTDNHGVTWVGGVFSGEPRIPRHFLPRSPTVLSTQCLRILKNTEASLKKWEQTSTKVKKLFRYKNHASRFVGKNTETGWLTSHRTLLHFEHYITVMHGVESMSMCITCTTMLLYRNNAHYIQNIWHESSDVYLEHTNCVIVLQVK